METLWLLALLQLFIKITLSDFEPAYLKVCSQDYKQVIDSSVCDRGIWLKSTFEPGCVCIRGVWALSNGFCDYKPVLIVGDGHCFHIPFHIRSAKFIGDPTDPFRPSIFVAPPTLDVILEIEEKDFTPALFSDSTLVIGVNPRQVAQRKDYGQCVDLEPKDYEKPLHIYQSARRVVTEWTLDPEQIYTCPTTTRYHHHVGFGEMFSVGKNKVEPKMLVERRCKQQCSAPNDTISMERTIKPFTIPEAAATSSRFHRILRGEKVSTLGNNSELLKPRLLPHILKSIAERQREREQIRATAIMELDHFEREVNEQTLRMMHAHISPLLLGIPGPRVMTREYRYFQTIREVVEKVCPEEYVPKQILKGLMRMFRQLLFETQDTLQHSQSRDDEMFNRTLSRLSECAENTIYPALMFNTYNESWSSRENLTDPKPERCPVPMIFAINGTEYNRTTYNTDGGHFMRNFTFYFPPHLKYNASQVDFVVESAWKVTMIGHYRCSKYFDDQTAIDFSHFFHQVQSFFNQRILKRWYYEKSVKATFDVIRLTFPSYDLRKFMFGLDSCLVGTQGFSNYDYSNIWIQRPKITYTDNDLTLTKNVLPGATSRLSTNDYAPPTVDQEKKHKEEEQQQQTPPHESVFRQTVNSDPGKKREKREAVKQDEADKKGYNLWNENARCINNYLEPAVNQKEFAYYLPPDCVIPMDPFMNPA